ncbi:hypothetical protein [Yersinia aleksiciae]|uniref:Lipoprotein n=1 Tax=Yersinia aleksiciae TaxID=263819 RepID=A0ABN4H4D3_YERAE|nr:hypothetical protein [Yersinia aleksiciae]AKP32196.1 hypothetical protein ACZ76_00830 [Yersinia aleksiciae]MDA5496733.1 hypothetical protein [Yersinia aleksiciae]NIL01111.1 hypothetical protein [Yersinia aleksiciae]WQC72215.1 hypothetical protein N0K21_07240 [Yersinia aleksiciae]CFQ34509.1 putative lipoprotein [Yersinia aleksiciae]
MINKIAVLVSIALLAGCSSQASRMSECESKGISKDTCYLAEQNRQASINNAAEATALQNAAKQYAQAAHKTVKTHLAGLDIRINAQNQMYVDGKPALITEQNEDATTYQQGIFNIIHYTKTHKLFVLQDGKIIGKGKA